METLIDEMLRYEATLPTIREHGEAALRRLLELAQGDTGQSRVVGLFLLGLYNGEEHPLDLTELRLLDHRLVEDCLTVLRMDSCPEKEVHEYFENGTALWQALRSRWLPEPAKVTTGEGLEITTTSRGFPLIAFTDHYGEACSLQVSSLADTTCCWLGVTAPNLKALSDGGLRDVPLPAGALVASRMHLTQDQVRALLPHLQAFTETGEFAFIAHDG